MPRTDDVAGKEEKARNTFVQIHNYQNLTVARTVRGDVYLLENAGTDSSTLAEGSSGFMKRSRKIELPFKVVQATLSRYALTMLDDEGQVWEIFTTDGRKVGRTILQYN